MLVDFKKLLEPLIDKFIGELQRIERERLEFNRDLVFEIEKTRKGQDNLKIQAAENDKHLSLYKDKLAEERVQQVGLNNQLKDEIARYSKLSKEFEIKLSEIEQNYKNSQVEKELISDALSRAKKKEDEFAAKTQSLKDDFSKLNTLKNELGEKEKNLIARVKAADKRETDLIAKGNQLNDTEFCLKAREKEVDRLIKRYELEKFIKES